eukprot:GEMP01088178.1.p1 GENE.GEMP01088178.1~~GEMP01088178.1.p1  ORF type:complete len:115 (-),score=2.45 GEMP01088178.1:401-745(-)
MKKPQQISITLLSCKPHFLKWSGFETNKKRVTILHIQGARPVLPLTRKPKYLILRKTRAPRTAGNTKYLKTRARPIVITAHPILVLLKKTENSAHYKKYLILGKPKTSRTGQNT